MPSTSQPPPPEPSRPRQGAQPDDYVRASDEEREAVASLLSESTAAGRLDLSELDSRLTAVYTVKTRGELRELVADLPSGQTAPTPPRPDAVEAPATSTPEPTHAAPSGSRLAPYSSWLFTGVICLVIWGVTSVAAGSVLYFWPVWVIVPWGLMLLSGAARGRSACGRSVRPRTQ